VVGAAFAVLALSIVNTKPAKIPTKDRNTNFITRENQAIAALKSLDFAKFSPTR
jgi:hypothetical protein